MTATDKIQEAPGEGGATHSASDIDDGNPDFQISPKRRSPPHMPSKPSTFI